MGNETYQVYPNVLNNIRHVIFVGMVSRSCFPICNYLWSGEQTEINSTLHNYAASWIELFLCCISNVFAEGNDIHIKISLKFVPKRPTDNKSALVQVKVWRPTAEKTLCIYGSPTINMLNVSQLRRRPEVLGFIAGISILHVDCFVHI